MIPRNRAYVSNFVSRFGINERDLKGMIDLSQGLSLNDCYWVVEEKCLDIFSKRNLYTQTFDTKIASVAFSGQGPNFLKKKVTTSELTTQGMFPKAWRIINGKILLYKTGIKNGLEPYSEFYASQIAEVMGLHFAPYQLSKWKGKICSTCELFTSQQYAFIPISRLINKGGMDAVLAYYKELGDEFYQELIDMLVFDAIILNEDRHFGNFGLLVDNTTNQIVRPAPIFDHGLSLFVLCHGR